MNRIATTDAEEIAEILRERIIEMRIATGDRLHQRRLAGDLGVSRPTIGQAVRLLEAEGLVERPGHGRTAPACVAGLDRTVLMAAYAMREGFDGLVARLATEHAGAGLDRQLAALLDEQRAALDDGNGVRFVRADSGFHTTLVDAADERALWARWTSLRSSTRCVTHLTPGQLRSLADAHEQIYDAVRSRRPASAERAAREHAAAAVALIDGCGR